MTNKRYNARSKANNIVQYKVPRRDVWYADLTEDARFDILNLPTRMNSTKALKYIKQTYGKHISQASYYRALDRLNANRLAATQLKAASMPPSLKHLEELTKTVRSIDITLKSILSKSK